MAEPDVLPNFEASESAAINLVAALQYFSLARDIIRDARKAQRLLRDHEVLTETLQGHAIDLERRIGTLDGELASKAELLMVQRAELAAAAEEQRAELDAVLEGYCAALDAKRVRLDAEFARYRDGEATSRVSRLNADIDALIARRTVLAEAIAVDEARLAEATARFEALRALVGKG